SEGEGARGLSCCSLAGALPAGLLSSGGFGASPATFAGSSLLVPSHPADPTISVMAATRAAYGVRLAPTSSLLDRGAAVGKETRSPPVCFESRLSKRAARASHQRRA